MSYKTTWTTTARDDFFEIMDYLLEKWGEKSAGDF